eukprot:gene8230-1982_t
MVTIAVLVGLVTAGPSPHHVKPHAHAPDYSKLNLVHYPYGTQPSTLNCTWEWFNQTLDHFAPGLPNGGETYYWGVVPGSGSGPEEMGPVFFYTGNESPVEEYVNNKHRYFGESFPRGPTGAPLTGVKDCLGFASSAQALADYATLIQHIKLKNKGAATSPVVAFGGSYGGMLASWFRIKYPNIVDGAIAASAPIWGLPLTSNAADTVNTKVSGSSAVLAHAAAVSGPDGTASHCATNVLAASILTTEIGKTADGRAAIGDAFRTCSPLKSEADVASVVSYFQGPWFDMSEG